MKTGVKNILTILLAVMVIVTMAAGCQSQGGTETTPTKATVATTAPTETTAATQATYSKDVPDVSIYGWLPLSWGEARIWAWRDGGDNAFEEWPGKIMKPDMQMTFEVAVPGWVDRVIIVGVGPEGEEKTAEIAIEPGKDLLIYVEDLAAPKVIYDLASLGMTGGVQDDPLFEAAVEEDYETMKALLPTIEDRSILKDWTYNDFNYTYAKEAFLNGDYETTVEFFGYCMFEDDQTLAVIFRQLLDGDVESAIDTKMELGYTTLDGDLDMTWPEIICAVTGRSMDPSTLDGFLMGEYLSRRMKYTQPTFSENSLVFGELSAWQSAYYVGPIQYDDYTLEVTDLDELYSKCGKEPNGKILVIRTQESFPRGTTSYAIDLLTMEYLSYDLFPSSLSEVEYIIQVDYDYTHEADYKQTFGSGEGATISYFSFLRMKGQVELLRAGSGERVWRSDMETGVGNVEAHFDERNYQCSAMPETGVHIISAVEKVREMNQG